MSAELSLTANNPDGKLFDIVSSVMVHGPCGDFNPRASCMVNRKCSKQFPKAFQDTTIMQENGYPFYRRRMYGQTHIIPDCCNPGQQYEVDNRWIVSHNPYLSRQYQAYINVEFCGSVKVIKYIHKYVYKRSDQTTVALNVDEVTRHLQGQYIGPTEAVWRLFEFPMHKEFPPVQELAVHLEGGQIVYFNPKLTKEAVRKKTKAAQSTLMAFLHITTIILTVNNGFIKNFQLTIHMTISVVLGIDGKTVLWQLDGCIIVILRLEKNFTCDCCLHRYLALNHLNIYVQSTKCFIKPFRMHV